MRGVVKPLVVAAAGAIAALLAVSALGVAAAEAPTGAAVARTISVEGVAIAPIPSHANAASANAVYREAMAKALADGQGKAAFLSEKAGAPLGAVDSVIEDGGYIECSSADSNYAEYEGEQPDFGSGPRGLAVAPQSAASTGAPTTKVSHRPKVKHKRVTAKKAAATSCNLTAQVSLVYAISESVSLAERRARLFAAERRGLCAARLGARQRRRRVRSLYRGVSSRWRQEPVARAFKVRVLAAAEVPFEVAAEAPHADADRDDAEDRQPDRDRFDGHGWSVTGRPDRRIESRSCEQLPPSAPVSSPPPS
jgi:hypothetical protein